MVSVGEPARLLIIDLTEVGIFIYLFIIIIIISTNSSLRPNISKSKNHKQWATLLILGPAQNEAKIQTKTALCKLSNPHISICNKQHRLSYQATVAQNTFFPTKISKVFFFSTSFTIEPRVASLRSNKSSSR